MTDSLVFIDPAGIETELTGGDEVTVLWGVIGRGMPKFDFVEIDRHDGGADVREVVALPKEVTVPIFLEGDDAPDLTDLIRALASKMNPLRGDGLLRSTRSGEERELVCRYAGGLELAETRDLSGTRWQRGVLIFRAASDPFWRDVEDVSEYVTASGSAGSFFPILPLTLLASAVFAETVVDNTGDAKAWPVWNIIGPTSGITLTNKLTGEVLAIDVAVDGDEYVVVDTRPGMKAVSHGITGENLYTLVTSHDLWGFEPGEQTIEIALSDTTSDTAVLLTYRRRHLTA
jgi:hypothetical protein